MTRTPSIRSEVLRLVRTTPFRRFALILESGDRVVIDHPENLAFIPEETNGKPASSEFYVLTNNLRMFSTFDAVSGIAVLDSGE